MGNYASEAIFHALNAIAFGAVYMLGIILFMAQTDIRLTVPLLLWLALYFGLMVWIVPRMVLAMETFMAAKSALLGRLVDRSGMVDLSTGRIGARGFADPQPAIDC